MQPKKSTSLSPLNDRQIACLIIMTSLMAMALIVANLTAIKIWNLTDLIHNLFESYLSLLPAPLHELPTSIRLASLSDWLHQHPLPVDGGIIIFPLTYIIGDLLVEIFGQRTADRIAHCGLLIGSLTCLCLWIVNLLPSYQGADNSSFTGIASMVSRVFIASLISFWNAQIVNNYVFVRLERYSRHFWHRALISSVFAHFVDSIIFETIAFVGRLPLREFVSQAVFAWLAGLALEALLLPITARCAFKLTRYLHLKNGQEFS